MSSLSTNVSSLSTNVSSLSTNVSSLSTGVSTLSIGVSSLSTSASSLSTGVSALSTGVSTLTTDVGSLSTGASSLSTGVSSLSTGVSSLSTGLSSVSTSVTSLSTGVSSLSTGFSSISTTVGSLSTGLSTVSTAVGSIGAGVAAALGGAAAYDAATGQLTGPSFATYNANGTTSGVSSVSSALQAINSQGIKYFHANSVLDDAQATGSNAVAIGPVAVASGVNAVALGNGAQATGTNSIALGTGALATGSVAVGANSRAGGGGAALGDNADAGGTPASKGPSVVQGTAIGFGALVQVNGGVAVGSGSVAGTPAGVPGYVPGGATAQQTQAVVATTGTQGAVSVGDAASGQYRQITGVAAGAADSDAVNVAQLKATNNDVSQVTQQINTQQRQIQSLSNDIANVSRLAYSGVAMSFAMTGTYLPTLAPGEKAVGVGLGGYQGYGAAALVYKQLSKDGGMSWGGGLSSTGREWGLNVGVGWKWN
ncbi:MAG: YadA-like family protein [Proteobacteria bacterium]|nr:YadA-like family protein [Pseudomonadota bacterium]